MGLNADLWNVINLQFSTNIWLYLGNNTRYSLNCYGTLIGNDMVYVVC